MLPIFHFRIERWKYNKTYEVYVSTLGNVRNRSKVNLAPKINQNGYCMTRVGGSKGGFILTHRLVMLTWRPTPEAEILTVDHLNHNKRDNSLENLEWVSRKENWKRANNDFVVEPASKICITGKNGKSIIINSCDEITSERLQEFCSGNKLALPVKETKAIVKEFFDGKNPCGFKKKYGYTFETVY